MHGCVCKEYGQADQVFECRSDLTKPEVSDPSHVLIANKRTTVNPADCKQRSGNLKLVMKHKFPFILGQDFAGTVIAVGSSVTKVRVGDEVFGSTAPRNSCSAEIVCAFEDECASKPSNITWDQAAATPTGFCTAWRGLFDPSYGNLPINPIDDDNPPKILILGASGSVGSAAVQLAVAIAKVNVVAICGSDNFDYVKSLGVSKVLDYSSSSSSNFERYLKESGVSFDLILDCVGGDDYYYKLFPYLNVERKDSSYITCVGPVLHGGSKPITSSTLLSTTRTLLPRFMGNLLPSQWNSRYKMYLSFTTKNGVLDKIANALIEGLIVPPRIDPDSPFPLQELGNAHALVETGHSNGKVVVKIES